MYEECLLGEGVFTMYSLRISCTLGFVSCVGQGGGVPFRVRTFASMRGLVTCKGRARVRLLLVSKQTVYQRIQSLSVKGVVVLSRKMRPPRLSRCPDICGCRSSSSILQRIVTYCNTRGGAITSRVTMLGGAARVVKVFSPLKHYLGASFTLALKRVLTGRQTILCLGVRRCSKFRRLVKGNFTRGLDSLLCCIERSGRGLLCGVGDVVRAVGGLSCIPPIRVPTSVHAAT